MGPLEHLIAGVIHLVVVGLDVVILFVVIRILSSYWPVWPWSALDGIGRPLIDPLLRAISRTPADACGFPWRRTMLMWASIVLFGLGVCRLAFQGVRM